MTASIGCGRLVPMNYKIPTEVALRVKDKLDEYLKLITRLEELEKDPDLSFLKKNKSTTDSKPIRGEISKIILQLAYESKATTFSAETLKLQGFTPKRINGVLRHLRDKGLIVPVQSGKRGKNGTFPIYQLTGFRDPSMTLEKN